MLCPILFLCEQFMHFHLLTADAHQADFLCVHGYLVDVKEDAHEGHAAKVLVLDPTIDAEVAAIDNADFPPPSLLTRIPSETSTRADTSPVAPMSLLALSVRRLPRKEGRDGADGVIEALEFLA